ncbi:hypothetical protein [Butyrivibrio proteoclasticus]|uniref:hypothetical protein n=1 Tax=Butyrivibrio proteoclasticus TaxID=43305 RepID=UPI00047A9225|nr:hypothetical protein [Butyrivibrio proteoclasticus]
MKRKSVIAIILAATMALSGCVSFNLREDSDEASDTQSTAEVSDSEIDEENAEEDSSAEDNTSEDDEEADGDSADVAEDDFSLDYREATIDDPWVEVLFEEDLTYEEVNDGKLDYSGIYEDNQGTNIPYAYCNLIKQLDGTYYCELYSYRSVFDEGTATYVSDGVLEYNSDYYTGTIEVGDSSLHLNICDNNGDSVMTDSDEYWIHRYPDLKDFVGTYSYYRDNMDVVTIRVYLDEHRLPMAEIQDGEEKVEFEFYPPYVEFWTTHRDGDESDMLLYITQKSIFYGPDDNYKGYVEGNCGDKYLAINICGGTAKVLYKCFEPHTLK